MYRLSRPTGKIEGEINLVGSKSLANRALIIQALATAPFEIEQLAAAQDTQRLQELLASDEEILNTGPAGTTYRFLTAYLCTKSGSQTLTGSARMLERPIGVLVDALRSLGAHIEYLGEEGFPPIRIGHRPLDKQKRVEIDGSTSSQFISALLMIAPTLPNGLELKLTGQIVSRPYIEMTLALMEKYGAQWAWDEEEQLITIEKGAYLPKHSQGSDGNGNFKVEADWSAASYYYSMAAISEEADLHITGLQADSLQGDSALVDIYQKFGVRTSFESGGVRLLKGKQHPTSSQWPPALIEQDFLRCPDLAQTLSVTCAALGTQGLFSGLETLLIKETDRIAALKTELAKLGVYLSKLPPKLAGRSRKTFYLQEGKAQLAEVPTFSTYHDHRMAMAFAPLAMLGTIDLEEPMVVAKSYPDFYTDLTSLGFIVEELDTIATSIQ
ncbi:MAG: 3-phosphoshikimate 1-carboxyvinyltransferase [Bacteroidota bacterium]